NNGTFSLLKNAGELDIKTIQNIEDSNFDSINKIYWRNSNLDFTSVDNFLNSLKVFPVYNYFIHKKNAVDELNFRNLIDDLSINKLLTNEYRIKLLWDVCRIPDFQKLFNDTYLQLLKTIFLLLIKNDQIPKPWLEKNILGLQKFNGGIEELSLKISQIRTWTYISNHQNWIDNEKYWQETTQDIENNLSDKLHKGLINRFVDTTSKYFISLQNDDKNSAFEIKNKKTLVINNIEYGSLIGFDLKFNKDVISHSLFSLSHVKKSTRLMIEEKINNFLNAPSDSINLGDINNINIKENIKIFWGEENIGQLTKGSSISSPMAEAINTEYLSSENKLLVSAKLQKWIDDLIKTKLWPLKETIDEKLSPNTRAIQFNLFESLGTLPIEKFKSFLKNISPEEKNALSKLGIRIGAKYFFVPNYLKKTTMELLAVLYCVFNDYKFDGFLPLPKDGRVSFESDNEMQKEYWFAIGYLRLNNFALRIDVFERIFFIARQKIKSGPFLDSADLMNPVGCNREQLKDILTYCGLSYINFPNERFLFFYESNKVIAKTKRVVSKKIDLKPKSKNKKISKKTKKSIDPNSPFAVLEKLL
ncbi:hypothetical protein OAL95_00120, partial [Alphaproteobacteria bacterium]|nr:hypothetical protein [Alphaproteobacteria bacterium]